MRYFSLHLSQRDHDDHTFCTENEAIVEWANDPQTKSAIVVTRGDDDFGITKHKTNTKIVRIPAFAFLYLLGHAEKEGYEQ